MYDDLGASDIVDEAPDAEKVYVGKRGGASGSWKQPDIDALADLWQKGQRMRKHLRCELAPRGQPTDGGGLDVQRAARMASWGLLVNGPIGHLWYLGLERMVRLQGALAIAANLRADGEERAHIPRGAKPRPSRVIVDLNVLVDMLPQLGDRGGDPLEGCGEDILRDAPARHLSALRLALDDSRPCGGHVEDGQTVRVGAAYPLQFVCPPIRVTKARIDP